MLDFLIDFGIILFTLIISHKLNLINKNDTKHKTICYIS